MKKIKNPLKTQKKEKIKKLIIFKTQSKKNKKTLNKGYLVKKLKYKVTIKTKVEKSGLSNDEGDKIRLAFDLFDTKRNMKDSSKRIKSSKVIIGI